MRVLSRRIPGPKTFHPFFFTLNSLLLFWGLPENILENTKPANKTGFASFHVLQP